MPHIFPPPPPPPPLPPPPLPDFFIEKKVESKRKSVKNEESAKALKKDKKTAHLTFPLSFMEERGEGKGRRTKEAQDQNRFFFFTFLSSEKKREKALPVLQYKKKGYSEGQKSLVSELASY